MALALSRYGFQLSSYIHRNLHTFHKASILSKTENRLKVCPGSLYHKKYVKFPIANKISKLEASFCKNVVAINI